MGVYHAQNTPNLNDRSSAVLKPYSPPLDRLNLGHSENPSNVQNLTARGISCGQAADLLTRRQHLALDPENRVFPASFSSRIKHAVSPGYHFDEVFRITQFVNEKLQNKQVRAEYLPLAEALLTRYKSDRPLQGVFKGFDRALAPFRNQLAYHHPENASEFQKWKKAGLPEEVFQKFPDFVHYLKESKIFNQLAATRDSIKIIDGEPAINVERQWVKESDLKARFRYEPSEKYNQVFVVEKATAEVFTYLDNGFGLQKHHPFLNPLDRPISVLNVEEYQKTLERAQKFQRIEDPHPDAERPHIIQIVSSKVEGPNTNLHNLVLNSKHPWFRYIYWNGDRAEVYEVGFVLPRKLLLPLISSNGAFRSPDSYEYTTVEERVVTNIAVSEEEFQTFRNFVNVHHNESLNLGRKLGFRFDQQNCTSFIGKGMEILNIPIPFKMNLKQVLGALLPDCVRNALLAIRTCFNRTGETMKKGLYCVIPKATVNRIVKAIRDIWAAIKKAISATIAFLLTPFRLFLGGAVGNRGETFRAQGERPEGLAPPLWNWKNYFSLSSYSFHLPGKLQQWQKEQGEATFIAKDPVRFAIVPPERLEEV